MAARTFFIIGILCTIVVFAAGLAHALSLPHKIGLSAEDYLRAQQLYAGWAFLGIASVGSLVLAIAFAVVFRGDATPFRAMIVASVAIALALVVFFAFTFPANRATQNWTMLPGGWEALRARWEYSHLAGAMLNGIAVVAELVAALRWRG